MLYTGTVSYMAPDVIESNSYNEKVDVYSFGLIVWEMLERRSPFPDAMQAVDVVMLVKDGKRPEFSELPSGDKIDQNSLQRLKALRQLVVGCWNNDPVRRPSFSEILQV